MGQCLLIGDSDPRERIDASISAFKPLFNARAIVDLTGLQHDDRVVHHFYRDATLDGLNVSASSSVGMLAGNLRPTSFSASEEAQKRTSQSRIEMKAAASGQDNPSPRPVFLMIERGRGVRCALQYACVHYGRTRTGRDRSLEYGLLRTCVYTTRISS